MEEEKRLALMPTEGFTDKWYWVEMPDEELPHAVLLNDPIQGECIARFKNAFDAQIFCKEQENDQLKKELEYWKHKV